MVQLRVMTDDRQRGEEVLELLVPLLGACTALRVSEPTELRHRGGGLRVVLDVQPAGGPAVRVEREGTPPATASAGRAVEGGRGRRQL